MPDISTFNNIAMADIATFNGQTVPSGTFTGLPVSSTGLLLWGHTGSTDNPITQEFFADAVFQPQSYQLSPSPGTDIIKIVSNLYGMAYLCQNGDVYTMSNSTFHTGRSTSQPTPEYEFHLSTTGASDLAAHRAGFFAIRSGQLWYCGQTPNLYLSGTVNSYNTWTQYGTDSDYFSIECTPNFAYKLVVLKGTVPNLRVYCSGYNNYGQLGNGLTSGTQLSLTAPKINSTTDFTDSISTISTGQYSTAAVTTSGDLYTWGYGYYGHNANGSTSNVTYVTQVTTPSTTWSKIFWGGITAFAIDTSGALYATPQNRIYYRITAALQSTRLMQQIGTDTDYEEIVAFLYANTFDSNFEGVILKKGGVWRIQGENPGWNGTQPESLTTVTNGADWKDANAIETPVGASNTITAAHIVYPNQNNQQGLPGLILAVS
jgi:hypothetical protein